MSQALRGQFVATVKANLALCREHFKLVLALPEFPATAAGQFIQLSCRNLETTTQFEERELEWPPSGATFGQDDELVGPVAYLRRPFSLAGRRDTSAGVELDIIHRVVGVGTDWLSDLLSEPAKEYPQYEAGLSLMPVLPPDVAATLLERRCEQIELELEIARSRATKAKARGLPRLFVIEHEYRMMLQKAELKWTRALAAEIRSGALEGSDEWRSWFAGCVPAADKSK